MYKKNDGFMLIQILVIVAIIGGLSLVLTSYMNTALQNQTYIERKFEALNLENSIRVSVTKGSFCKCNFSGAVKNAITFSKSNPPTNLPLKMDLETYNQDCSQSLSVLAKVGAPIPNSKGLSVKSIELTNISTVVPGEWY